MSLAFDDGGGGLRLGQARAGGPRYFKHPKQGMAITALAGPISNFVLAYLSALVYSGLYAVMVVKGSPRGWPWPWSFFSVLILLNIGLGIFNLIPIPPLDGSKVLAMFLPDRLYLQWMRLERYGMIILMALLWFGVLDGFFDDRPDLGGGRDAAGVGLVFQGVLAALR